MGWDKAIGALHDLAGHEDGRWTFSGYSGCCHNRARHGDIGGQRKDRGLL